MIDAEQDRSLSRHPFGVPHVHGAEEPHPEAPDRPHEGVERIAGHHLARKQLLVGGSSRVNTRKDYINGLGYASKKGHAPGLRPISPGPSSTTRFTSTT